MKHLTEANAATKICADLRRKHPRGITVTSHDFQRTAMQQFQTEFALDFLPYIKEKDALQAFSLAFGKWLSLQLLGHATGAGRVKTKNLRGEMTDNQQWDILPKTAPVALKADN